MEGGLWGKLNSLPLLCLITSIESILGTCKRVDFEGHILQIYNYISLFLHDLQEDIAIVSTTYPPLQINSGFEALERVGKNEMNISTFIFLLTNLSWSNPLHNTLLKLDLLLT